MEEEHKVREIEAQRKLEVEQAKQNNLGKEKENLQLKETMEKI